MQGLGRFKSMFNHNSYEQTFSVIQKTAKPNKQKKG